jgi:hypothetical protein
MSIEQKYPQKISNGKVFLGLILLAIGAKLLLEQFTWFFFPDWLISFPTFVILLGLYIGAKSNFKKPFPIILIAFGVFLLFGQIFPRFDAERIFWPLAIIVFGIWMIVGRNQQWNGKFLYKMKDRNAFNWQMHDNPFDPKPTPDPNYDPNAPAADQPFKSTYPPYSGDDHIDTVSVFGGVKRTVLSKDFKGGEIVNIFGGTDLDMTQADINGRVIIDITQLFGGIKLIIPPHWQVTSDVAAVFSSVDDKRRSMGTPLSPDKILVIKGVSIFAGVDIRSF